MNLKTDLFDFSLPPELIAQRPAERRDGSRMLVMERATGNCEIMPFPEITRFLTPGDAMIYNDTKVMRARMYGRKDGRPDGAKIEILLVTPGCDNRHWHAFLKPGKRATPGTEIALLDDNNHLSSDTVTVLEHNTDGSFLLEFHTDDIDGIQQKYGHIPLPPYIQRGDENADAERYQTIFAHTSGAVAAPTAGLHFTPEVIAALKNKGVKTSMVTLHVGPGTFKPVSVDDVTKHHMHSEQFFLTEETADLINRTHAARKKVLAVGTTTVRVLESCASPEGLVTPRTGWTDIFLYPPYQPRAVDMLLTNFHLPKSTLIMLVSTFADREKVLAAYEYAIKERMRFYSYGDCMLLI